MTKQLFGARSYSPGILLVTTLVLSVAAHSTGIELETIPALRTEWAAAQRRRLVELTKIQRTAARAASYLGSSLISGTSSLYFTLPFSSTTTTDRAKSPARGPEVMRTP